LITKRGRKVIVPVPERKHKPFAVGVKINARQILPTGPQGRRNRNEIHGIPLSFLPLVFDVPTGIRIVMLKCFA